MKKRIVKPRSCSSGSRKSHKPIFYALAFLLLAVAATFLLDLRKDNKTKEAETVKSAVEVVDQNGDAVSEPVQNAVTMATKRPAQPPKPYPKRIPKKEILEFYQSKLKEDKKLKKIEVNKTYFELPKLQGAIKSWEDLNLIANDLKREGIGEQGKPEAIEDESMKELEATLSMENGFNALLSDRISVNRSIADNRPKGCLSKQYLAQLPTASIVIPFFNEYLSVLQRTLHSIVNRTPAELLREIIIVDDFSDRDYLREELDVYVEQTFTDLVKIVRLPSRTGLIGARLAGARRASGDVLIFFDSHIECGYNWLPPLLEPIARNNKVSTCPIVDVIEHKTFGYRQAIRSGVRGAFDWEMYYKMLPQLPEFIDTNDETKLYPNPVMMGGLFAIDRDFFWQLGGYDEGLDIWGAEQYELSFKIWMCGGLLLDVPCSRVAHIFRGPMHDRPNVRKYNFVARNHKRVAEVWMDDYKYHFYARNPNTYDKVDPGNLTEQKLIRQQLQCKSFQWYLDEIVPDLLHTYPAKQPDNYASGVIQNLAYSHLCLDTMQQGTESQVGLYSCADNHTHPQSSQFWTLSGNREIRLLKKNICLDVHKEVENAPVWMWKCHLQGGNQFWYYDPELKWLVHSENAIYCMEAVPADDGSNQMLVVANVCDNTRAGMKWNFGSMNATMLDMFWLDV